MISDALISLEIPHGAIAFLGNSSAPPLANGYLPVMIAADSSSAADAATYPAVVLGTEFRDDCASALARAAGLLDPGSALLWPIGSSGLGRDHAARLLFGGGFEQVRFQSHGETLFATARKVATERPSVLSVVLPVFNERETFRQVVDALQALNIAGIELEIIVVESNSTDGTREEVLKLEGQPGFQVVLEEVPQGKGHAVRNGLAHATGDFVLIQDADLEYDLGDYERLLAPLRRAEANFVLGVRTATSGAKYGVRHFERQVLVSRLMNIGNAVFLALFNVVYRAHLKDPFTMYKVLRRDCLVGVTLECNRFDLDWELTGKLLRLGYQPLELPVSYTSRSFSDGKKISVLRDPWTWVVACFKYRIQPVRSWAS